MSFAPHRGKGVKTRLSSNGRTKVHTAFEDGSQMVEEYDAFTSALLVRRHRYATAVGGMGAWAYEVGAPPARRNEGEGGQAVAAAAAATPLAFDPENDLIAESSRNPALSRRDTPSHFVWQVSNLPYPKETYSVRVEKAADPAGAPDRIVLRTSNKKYFKRLEATDSPRLDESALEWDWSAGTLVIAYAKPPEVRARDRRVRDELKGRVAGGRPEEGGSSGVRFDVVAKPEAALPSLFAAAGQETGGEL